MGARLLTLGLTLGACQKHGPGQDVHPRPAEETVETVGPTSTDLDTGNLFTALEKVALGPAITIVGQTAEELGEEGEPEYIGIVLGLGGDLWGDGHETLVTAGWWKSIFFRSLATPGEIPSTTYDAAIVGGVAEDQRPAGDVNNDGFADTWKGHRLFLGPLEPEVDWETDWHARIEESSDIGPRMEGGFDADGDGWMDVVSFSYETEALIYYGPFQLGEVRYGSFSEQADPSQLTSVEASCSGQVPKHPWVRDDFFGPGHPAVALGNNEPLGYYCQSVVQIHDISGPRGQRLNDLGGTEVLWDSYLAFWPAGDLDGDGTVDLIGAGAIVLAPDPAKGQLRDQLADVVFEPVSSAIGATGDMDGDGRPEVLVRLDKRFIDIPDFSAEYWIVPSAAFRVGEPIDIVQTSTPVRTDDVPFDGHWIDFTSDPWVSGDLDGDGKAEIAVGDALVAEGGRIFVWRGADLFP